MGRQLVTFGNNTYTYNEDGIRTSKTVGNALTTFYLDSANIIEQITGNTVLHFYYDSYNEIIGFEYGDNNYYYVKNAMSDIVGIIDSDGNLITSYQYDPWGKVLSVTGSNTEIGNLNPFRYRSYYYDVETGFYYLQSRYYDPETGRFINCDDVNYIGVTESAISYNPFAYCENNPMNGSDPSGHLCLNANWFGFALDIAFTAIGSWFKFGYDVIGAGLKYYATKKGFTLFYYKLMNSVVPKVRGLFGYAFTLMRQAMWRVVGNVSGNMISGFLSYGIQKIAKFFSDRRYIKSSTYTAIYLVTRMLTLGSLVALVLDWASDGNPYNERIYI